MDKRLKAAIDASLAAGRIAAQWFGKDAAALGVEAKADGSPVTQADRQCEEVIRERLRLVDSSLGFFGEEFGEEGDPKARWIIDPIDGTKNFVRGIPWFATLIALELDGDIELGVIHNPMTGELYYAKRGFGAFSKSEQIRVSAVGTLSDAHVSFGGLREFQESGQWPIVETLTGLTARQRGFGDYLGHVMVASGRVDVMIELGLQPYDMAPLMVLVEEAGGTFTDVSGKRSIYSGGCISCNERLRAPLTECLARLAGAPGRSQQS